MSRDLGPAYAAGGAAGLSLLRRAAFDGLAAAGRDWSDRQVCEEALAHVSELADGTSTASSDGRLWQVGLRLRLASGRHAALAAVGARAADPVGGVAAALDCLADDLRSAGSDPRPAAARAESVIRLELALLIPPED